MINLLPPDYKKEVRAARSNSILLRYNISTLGALLFLLAAIAVTFFYISGVKNSAEQTISESQARVASYQKVKQEADQFRTDLATAKQVLDKEVTYTKVILQISQLLPDGVILQQLSLDASTFGTPTTLTVQAKSNQAALKLKDSFQSSKLFSDVHFRNITVANETAYPYSVTLGITINKEAATE